MRRLLTLLAIFTSMTLPLILPATVSAAYNPFQAACNPGESSEPGRSVGTPGGPACSTNVNDNPLLGQGGTLSQVISILSIVLGVIAVIFIVVGGIKYVTSNGDSAAVSSAKNTIIYALVGLVVAVLARPIINFVLGRIQ